MVPRPQADEYGPYYGQYIGRVPEGSDLFAVLSSQPDELRALLGTVNEALAGTHPAPGEWSIKEVIGHINDAERIFAYRTLRVARADETPLPGFDQDPYVTATNFNARTLSDLLDEFAAQRHSNVLCFQPLTDAELARRGTASGYPVSTRAILYMMAGHVMHHVVSLKTDYHVE
jgi:hypothetical protein